MVKTKYGGNGHIHILGQLLENPFNDVNTSCRTKRETSFYIGNFSENDRLLSIRTSVTKKQTKIKK